MSSADYQRLLSESARRHNVPGAVFALYQDDVLNVHATGELSVDTNEPVRIDSLFQIGSITKVLTASLIMALVDESRIDLDEPVRRYLPGFRTADIDAANLITVRQLLCHSSGLDGDFFTDTGGGSDRLARYVDRCALLPHLFEPGTDFSYCNSGFKLAGRIAEVITGLDFDTALKKYIIAPMLLKNTAGDPKDLVGRSLSSGHVVDPEDASKSIRLSTLYTLPLSGSPAGSTVMMSAEDLVSFARMHLAGGRNQVGDRVLSESSVAAMQAMQVRVPVPARGIDAWALGWFFQDVDGAGVIGHDGGTIGQSSFLRIDRKTGCVAVLFANGGSAIDLYLDLFRETFDPIAACPTPKNPAAQSAPHDLERYVGTYKNLIGDTRIEAAGDTLTRYGTMRIDDAVTEYPPARLDYIGDDDFVLRADNQVYPTTISFRRFSDDGQPQSLFTGLRWHHRAE